MDYYSVIWTNQAENDRAEIFQYLVDHAFSLVVASKQTDAIIAAVDDLSFFPHYPVVDRFGLAKLGYRKRRVGNYIIFFRVDEVKKTVTIETIMHGARDWAGILRDKK